MIKLQPYYNSFGYEIEDGIFELTNIDFDLVHGASKVHGRIFISQEAKENGFRAIDEWEDIIPKTFTDIKCLNDVYNYIIEHALETDDALYNGFKGAKLIKE